MSENNLAAFIAELATSPGKLRQYRGDADAAMAAAGLSEDERNVLGSGDWKTICEFMGDDDPRPVLVTEGGDGGGTGGGTGDSGGG